MALLKFGPSVKAYGLGYAENEIGDLDDKTTLSVMKPSKDDPKKLVPTDVSAVDFLTDQGMAFALKADEKKAYDTWKKTAGPNDAFILGQ